MSSFTHSHPTTTGVDDDDLVLWLHCKRGDALASPPPLLSSHPRSIRGRIIVIEISSPEATEGHALPREREVPPPVRRETLILSKEEDSLLEAPWWVSSDEELPTEMTFQSIMGYSIEPLESLPLMLMAESDRNKHIMEDEILRRIKESEGRRKGIASRRQGSMRSK